jgi:hypothetical protein
MSTDNRRGQRSRRPDIAGTVFLLIVHGFLYGATIALLIVFNVLHDTPGGDLDWAARAMALGIWGGAALWITDFVVAVYRLIRRRGAVYVPVIGCMAQFALAIAAVVMEVLSV